MPSPTKTQLNLSVDTNLKEQFKALCDKESISLAKAFESFMSHCITSGNIISSISPSISPSTNVESMIEDAIANLRTELKEEIQKLSEMIPKLPIENAPIRLENQNQDVLPIEKDKVAKKGISARKLAERLHSNHVQIGREWLKGETQFAKWSKSKDPEHIAWTKHNNDNFYQLIDT